MPERLIDMIEERFPEENYTLVYEEPKGRLLGEEVPKEQRLLIYIQRINPYDRKENGREIVMSIDQKKPLSKIKRWAYIGFLRFRLLGDYLLPSD